MFEPSRTFVAFIAASALASILCACTAHGIRLEALDDLYAGRYEDANRKARDGVARDPEDSELRETLLRVQDEAVTLLLMSANDLRARGDESGAKAAVGRAAGIAPSDERVRRALARLDQDGRSSAALGKASELLAQGHPKEAAAALRPAVLEDPRNSQVQAFQRRLDAMLYQEVATGPRLVETGPITLEFRDAPVRQVFDALSRESKVNFVVDKDIRPDQRVTVFAHRVGLERALDLLLSSNQLAKKVLDPTTVLVYANTAEKAREYQELIVRSFFLSHAEAKQVAAALKTVLKIREPYVDERMNMIILRDAPQQIEAAEKLLAVLDQSEPEVMVDVAVLEVNSNRLLDVGIQLPDSFTLTPLPPASSSVLTVGNIAGLGRNRVGLGISPATINIQSQDGDATVLANPRIRAKSREKAHILIGDKYPVVTATAAPTAGFISQNVTYIDVGIKVEIEPVVGLDGDVTIKLNLEVSSIANQITTSSGTVAYQIGTRSAGTTLRLQDGETQVLGGLISKNNSTSANRIPGLGDLPIAGRLFSSQNDSSQRDEVVLSITPHIISNLQRPEAASGAFFSGTDASTHLAIADTAQEAPRPPSAQGVPVAPISNPDALPTPPTTSQLPASPAIGPVLPPANAIPSSAPPLPPSVASGLAVLVNAPVAVRAGDMLTVSITANIATALRAVPIEITYDPAKLRFEGFEAGQLLGDPHEASVSHSVYPAEGRVTLAIASNRPQGLSGSGVLGTLRFTAMQLGSAKLQMTAVTPMGALGPVPAPTLAAPAIVQVQ